MLVLCVGVFCLHVYICIICTASDLGGEQKASDPPNHRGSTDGCEPPLE